MAIRTVRTIRGARGRASIRLVLVVAVCVTMLWLIPGSPSSAATQTFTNPTPIALSTPNGGPFGGQEPGCPTIAPPYNNSCHGAAGLPWPSPVAVSGVTGPVTDVNVVLNGFWEAEAPADVDMLLIGPDGTTMIILMSDACGTSGGGGFPLNPIPEAAAINITFSDGAPGLPADGVCTTGTFAPVDDDIILNPDGTPVDGYTDHGQFPFQCCDRFAAITGNPTITFLPAPTVIPADPNELVSLTVFNSLANPNGTWNLYMINDQPDTAGRPTPGGLTGGWSLQITTADTTTTTAPTTTTTAPTTTTTSSTTTTTAPTTTTTTAPTTTTTAPTTTTTRPPTTTTTAPTTTTTAAPTTTTTAPTTTTTTAPTTTTTRPPTTTTAAPTTTTTAAPTTTTTTRPPTTTTVAPTTTTSTTTPPGLTCLGKPATIVGTPGPDTISGTSGPDVILGLGGNDRIFGNGGNDTICAGDGDDAVFGGTGNDVIAGGPGRDDISGDAGDDDLRGEPNDDRLAGGTGNDRLDGGTGINQCAGGSGTNILVNCN